MLSESVKVFSTHPVQWFRYKEKKWQISKNLSKALICFFSRFFVTTHFDNFFFFLPKIGNGYPISESSLKGVPPRNLQMQPPRICQSIENPPSLISRQAIFIKYRHGQPNWEYTVWKFQDFSATQISREINFVIFRTLSFQ